MKGETSAPAEPVLENGGVPTVELELDLEGISSSFISSGKAEEDVNGLIEKIEDVSQISCNKCVELV